MSKEWCVDMGLLVVALYVESHRRETLIKWARGRHPVSGGHGGCFGRNACTDYTTCSVARTVHVQTRVTRAVTKYPHACECGSWKKTKQAHCCTLSQCACSLQRGSEASMFLAHRQTVHSRESR